MREPGIIVTGACGKTASLVITGPTRSGRAIFVLMCQELS